MVPEVRASDPGSAWRLASKAILAQGIETFHLVVRIGNAPDDMGVRNAVSELQAGCGLAGVETVSNTIFPLGIASTSTTYAELAARYRALYPRLRTVKANKHGTYFGRMVDHPGGDQHSDQLSHVIEKLRQTITGNNWTSRYEMPIYHPKSDAARLVGFPCMSHCAFHLDAANDRLHLLAVYRNQYMVERAYGNYLGLSRLRDYVAGQVRRNPGELVVVAGHANVETAITKVRACLGSLDTRFGAL